MKNNKKLRRNIRRIAEKYEISYDEAILKFYNVSSLSKLDKNLFFSLSKKPSKSCRFGFSHLLD